MKNINLVSDTATRPTPEMLKFMMNAEVGDDVFRADPSVNELEEKAANMFGMESALFCPSGTMTNQIAIKTHTQALDEVICHEYSHIYQYETGGYAFNSGVALSLLQGPHGKITAKQIEENIRPVYDWLPITKMVSLENTVNKAGGSYYTIEEINPITALCKERKLKLHLDGARIFNALTETQESTQSVGKLFDSISICLSKGLGAPVGSLLLGTEEFIRQSRRYRKVMGGGMRQAGYLAAAGLYALENNLSRLKEDHQHAESLAQCLKQRSYTENVLFYGTNIIFFDIKGKYTVESFINSLDQQNIQAVPLGKNTVRFVTHLDVSNKMIDRVISVLEKMENK